MKTKLLLATVLVALFCIKTNAQDSIKINVDNNHPNNICPKELCYYSIAPNSQYTTTTWKVTGGHFNSANSGETQIYGTLDKVPVFWDNVASANGAKTTGTIEVEVYISSQQKTLKGKYVQNIKSLNGVSMTKLETNISTELPYGMQEFRVAADRLQFPQLKRDNGQPLYVNKYEWTLPSGWKSKSGQTGTFVLQQDIPILDIVTDDNSIGPIKVRAVNDCLGIEDASKYSELQFSRKGFGLGEYPQTVSFGEMKTYTFSVVGTDRDIEWQAPSGWIIHGSDQGNSYTGGNVVQITTSECPTNEKVRVRLVQGNDYSEWTEFPTTVSLPTINLPSGEIKQYQSATFSLDMPDNDIASVEWLVNGGSVGTATNTSSLSFLVSESGKVKISAKLTLEGCSPVSIPEVEIDVTKAPDPTISGPSTVCDRATYSIENFDELPPGATVNWSCGPYLSISSEQGMVSCQFTVTGNGSSWVSAEIDNNGVPVSLPYYNTWTGNPRVYGIEGPVGISQYATEHYRIDNSKGPSFSEQGITTYYWSVTDNLLFERSYINQTDTYIKGLTPGKGTISFLTVNTCGTSAFNLPVLITSTVFAVYPNPATDMVTVELQEEQPADAGLSTQRTTTALSTGSYEIQLWSASAMLRRFTTDQPVSQIPVSGLPAGIYFVRVIKDGQTHTKRLIKR